METVEYEIDDVHSFMIDQMTEGDVDREEFVTGLIDQTIYSTYQQYKDAQREQPKTEELIEEAEPAD